MDKNVFELNRLIMRLAKGDKRALEHIYKKYSGIMLFYAKQYLFDKTFAEDVVSDVFLNIFLTAKNFDFNKNGLNYIIKATHNTAINYNRKYNLNNLYELDENSIFLSPEFNPDESMINDIQLKTAIASLSPTEKQVILFKFFHGLTVREIADKLSISKSNVQNIVKKSLSKMADIIDEK